MQESYIDDPGQLLAFCEQIRHSPWLALDTEFVREKTYSANLCLIQLCNRITSYNVCYTKLLRTVNGIKRG